MFSKINNLLLRDKLHIAKLRKISQLKANLSRKSFAHKKIISNCLANTHSIYNYTAEIQHLMLSALSLNKRWILKLLKQRIKVELNEHKYIESLTDEEVVSAILNRDARITRLYLYEKCYPLFKARYDKYYTDCESCIEFINEIYAYIMTPGVKTGKCYLSTFGFSCSLTCWLKIVAENYCHQLFKKRIDIIDASEDVGGRKTLEPISPNIDSLNRRDVEIVLSLMPNKRYSSLIHLRYVEEKSNEETADILGMSMDNYYNKHKLAKEQFAKILRKEGLI